MTFEIKWNMVAEVGMPTKNGVYLLWVKEEATPEIDVEEDHYIANATLMFFHDGTYRLGYLDRYHQCTAYLSEDKTEFESIVAWASMNEVGARLKEALHD